MPGYIRGFVEREFADGWELVCRVDPFTGSQGDFKYVFLGTGWASPLDPVVHTKGFPEDLAPATKLAMLGRGGNAMDRLSKRDLHNEFAKLQTDFRRSRHVYLEQLLEFDWESGVSDDARNVLVDHGPEKLDFETSRLFYLVDDQGNEISEWDPEPEDDWRQQLPGKDNGKALLRGEWIELEDRRVSLQARGRHKLLPDDWFDLLRLLHRENDYRDVRFTFYWHH